MMREKKLTNGWNIKVKETSDFKSIITNEEIILFGLDDIDVYGTISLNDSYMLTNDLFFNIVQVIDISQKEITFSFSLRDK
jgi:hypothetical protein